MFGRFHRRKNSGDDPAGSPPAANGTKFAHATVWAVDTIKTVIRFGGKERVMKRAVKGLCIAAVLGCLTLGTGCASLSLFSSEHYHGTEEINKRINSLEQRMNALEGKEAHRHGDSDDG